jgi:hypothetical protein
MCRQGGHQGGTQWGRPWARDRRAQGRGSAWMRCGALAQRAAAASYCSTSAMGSLPAPASRQAVESVLPLLQPPCRMHAPHVPEPRQHSVKPVAWPVAHLIAIVRARGCAKGYIFVQWSARLARADKYACSTVSVMHAISNLSTTKQKDDGASAAQIADPNREDRRSHQHLVRLCVVGEAGEPWVGADPRITPPSLR